MINKPFRFCICWSMACGQIVSDKIQWTSHSRFVYVGASHVQTMNDKIWWTSYSSFVHINWFTFFHLRNIHVCFRSLMDPPRDTLTIWAALKDMPQQYTACAAVQQSNNAWSWSHNSNRGRTPIRWSYSRQRRRSVFEYMNILL